MITKDSIESAYCFFHQKWRVYAHSSNRIQQDDIEYAIASYIEGMSGPLYEKIAQGKKHFLIDHLSFATDMPAAIERLEGMMHAYQETLAP
jgi:hypothetical protein